MSAETRLRELGIVLPRIFRSRSESICQAVQVGELLYVAWPWAPSRAGGDPIIGKIRRWS